MSGLTNYYGFDMTDLSFVFMPLSSGTQYSTPSLYLLSSGADLTTIFARYTSVVAPKTGYLLSSGADLNTIFQGRPLYTTTSTVSQTYTGGRYVITIT